MVYQSLMLRPLTEAEALAAEMVALHPALSLNDALDIATRNLDTVLV